MIATFDQEDPRRSESGGILVLVSRSSYSLFDVEARSLLASAFTQYKDIGQCGKRRILYSDSDRMRNHLGLVKILSFPWVSSKELFLILFVFKILLSNKCSEQLI